MSSVLTPSDDPAALGAVGAILIDTENLFRPFGWQTLDERAASQHAGRLPSAALVQIYAAQRAAHARELRRFVGGHPDAARHRLGEVIRSLHDWAVETARDQLPVRRGYGKWSDSAVREAAAHLDAAGYDQFTVSVGRDRAELKLLEHLVQLEDDIDVFVLGSADKLVRAEAAKRAAETVLRFVLVLPSDARTAGASFRVGASYETLGQPPHVVAYLDDIHVQRCVAAKRSDAVPSRAVPDTTADAADADQVEPDSAATESPWPQIVTDVALGGLVPTPSRLAPFASSTWCIELRNALWPTAWRPHLDEITDRLVTFVPELMPGLVRSSTVSRLRWINCCAISLLVPVAHDIALPEQTELRQLTLVARDIAQRRPAS